MTEDLAAVLDQCLKDLDEGMSLDECLAKHADLAAEIEPLLRVAVDLRHLPKPTPSPKAAGETLVRLGTALIDQGRSRMPAPKRSGRRSVSWAWPRPLVLRWVVAGALIIVLTWGITIASAKSLPGDLLYPLKLATERVTFAITREPGRRAELRLSFADRRLNELLGQAQEGGQVDPALLKQLLREADLALNEAQPIPDDRYRVFLTRLHRLNAYQQAVLEDLKSSTSRGDSAILGQAISVCEERGRWMQQMGCGGETLIEDPPETKSQTPVRRQVTNTNRERTTNRSCWGSDCRW